MKVNLLEESSKKELDLDVALTQAIKHIGHKKNKILSAFERSFQYCDDPQFYQYSGRVITPKNSKIRKIIISTGISFTSPKESALKSLCEALERYASINFDDKKIIFTEAKNLKKPYLDVESIAGVSKKQRKESKEFTLNSEGKFGWVLGYKLPSMEEVHLPAQSTYVYYTRKSDEGFIKTPISSGTAVGSTYSSAIYRGICECIEHEAFMITYLNELPCPEVILDNATNEEIKVILEQINRYNLELRVFDISTDLGIYTFWAILVDKTGIGPAITVGGKSGLDPQNTILGAMLEVFTTRLRFRESHEKFDGEYKDLLFPETISKRGLLWSQLKTIKNLNFLLQNDTKPKKIEEYVNKSKADINKDLEITINLVKKKLCTVYFADITPDLPNIKKTDFKVVKVIIPELAAFYLNEKFKCLGGKRLYQVPVKTGYFKEPKTEEMLNSFPHPFL